MAKVQVNVAKLNARPVIPASLYVAEIINCEFPFQAPWDSENFGVNFEFQIAEEGPHKGRRLSMFCTTTPTKTFSNRYGEVLSNLGIEPSSEWETDTLIGRKVCIRVIQYTAKATGETKNGVEEVFQTS